MIFLLYISITDARNNQVSLNIFSSMRRNTADATLEKTCTVSAGDWKNAILDFPAHHFDTRWIVTTVTWLLSWQLFESIYATDEDISTDIKKGMQIVTENIDDYVRLILKDYFWYELLVSNGIKVEFGYDFYMYVSCPKLEGYLIRKYSSIGIFIESIGL